MQNIQQTLIQFKNYIFTFRINKTLDNMRTYMYNNCAIKHCAAMAQSVERILGKDEVTGSIPVSSSKKFRTRKCAEFFVYYLSNPPSILYNIKTMPFPCTIRIFMLK